MCHGCDDNSFCDSPGISAQVTRLTAFEETPCQTFGGFFVRSLSASEVGPEFLAKAVAGTPPRAFLRVPKMSDPLSWSTSLVTLTDPSTTIQDSGWLVTFLRTSGGPISPSVIPATVPTDLMIGNDKVYSAYVVLPEAGGPKQYWVPVTERINFFGYRFAQLQTAEWTVMFFRDPAPP